MKAKFPLGQVVATPAALKALSNTEIVVALGRHAQGDWGKLDDHDHSANDFAVDNHMRLLSVYHANEGIEFWIIVRRDRRSSIAG